jgi:ribonuclease D
MMDIVEKLENLIVKPHQQGIIDAAVDEIERLREALQQCVTILETRQKRFEDDTAWGGSAIAQRKARFAAAAIGQMLNEIRKHVRSILGEQK